MSNGFSEVKGFGTVEPDWPAMPEHHTVPEVAAHYLRHRISVYLRGRKITAAYLAAQLGGKETAWRSRLNSTRGLSTDELIALFMLFPDIPQVVIPCSVDVDDWLPPSYAGLASGRVDGSGVPTFRTPEIDWATVSSEIAKWWAAGTEDGTALWSVNADVLTHQILQQLDGFGLPRGLAAPGEPVGLLPETVTNTSSVRIDWMTRDTSVTALWLDPFATPRAAQVHIFVTALADALWSDRPDALPTDVSVIAAPATVIGAIRDVLQESTLGESRSVVLSLNHARRLGVTDPATKPDLHVSVLDDGTGPLLWLLIKAMNG